MKRLFWVGVPALLVLAALYTAFVLKWNYSTGERAGWVQKLSHKGWLCKTWEGELAMVSMPGATVEKFHFTVKDDAVAEKINQVMGRRVRLHYEEKVGIPTTCFGETMHWVNRVEVVDDIPLAPGIVVPSRPAPPPQPEPTAPPAVSPNPPPTAPATGSAPPAAPVPPPAAGASTDTAPMK
jgi:hypothetical protein